MRLFVVLSSLLFVLLLGGIGFLWLLENGEKNTLPVHDGSSVVADPSMSPSDTPVPTVAIPDRYVIDGRTHAFQTFNNCGPATLSMALSYFGLNYSQATLGNILRPYQVPGGDNDDKSVTLAEVASQAEEYGLHAYLRPNGTPEKLEKFIAQGLPIITRTWLKEDEDIGHYRVVRGYDRTAQTLVQDDSLQGKDLTYTYDEFNAIWQPFNYEYLVLADDDRRGLVEQILAEEKDEQVAWRNALIRVENEMQQDPDNWHLRFAKSRIHYYLGEYEKSVTAFEEVEDRLSFRTLWYQIEPIRAYYELGQDERVFSLTDRVLNNQNRAFSELYVLRGKIHERNGNIEAAREQYQLAVQYNQNLIEAKEAFDSLAQ